MNKGKIIAFSGHPLSNLKELILDTDIVFLDGSFAINQFYNAFGSLKEAIGKEISFSTDAFNILEGFTPIEVI